MSKPLCDICKTYVAIRHLTPETIVCARCYVIEKKKSDELRDYFEDLKAEVNNAKT